MFIILEIDKKWLFKVAVTKYAISISLGFIALTLSRMPFYRVRENIKQNAIEEYRGCVE